MYVEHRKETKHYERKNHNRHTDSDVETQNPPKGSLSRGYYEGTRAHIKPPTNRTRNASARVQHPAAISQAVAPKHHRAGQRVTSHHRPTGRPPFRHQGNKKTRSQTRRDGYTQATTGDATPPHHTTTTVVATNVHGENCVLHPFPFHPGATKRHFHSHQHQRKNITHHHSRFLRNQGKTVCTSRLNGIPASVSALPPWLY